MAIVPFSKFVGKAYLFSLAFCLLYLGGLKAQTSNPSVGSFTSCSATSQTCSFGTYSNSNLIKAMIVPSSLTSTQATFEIQKCSGNFGTAGIMYVKNTLCGNSLGGGQNYSIGASSIRVTINHNLSTGQSGTFYTTLTSGNGTYYYAGPFTITMPVALNAPTLTSPTDGQVLASTATSVNLQWNKNNTGTDVSYVVRLRNVTTNVLVVNDLSVGNTSSHLYSGLQSGHAYQWIVKAVRGSEFAQPNTSSQFTVASPPCNPPTNLSYSNITETGFTATWAAVANATSYNVRVYKNGVLLQVGTYSATTNSRIITGLLSGTNYNFSVTTFCGATESDFSSRSAMFTTLIAATCAPPSNLTANTITNSSFIAQWTASPDVVSYEVKITNCLDLSFNSPNLRTITLSSANATSVSMTGLTASTGYIFRVETICANGLRSGTANSISSCITTTAAPIAVTPPIANTPTTNTVYVSVPSTIAFSWTKNNPTGLCDYILTLRNTTTQVLIIDETTGNVGDVSSFTYNSSTLTAGHAYQWSVKAKSRSNPSDFRTTATMAFTITASTIPCSNCVTWSGGTAPTVNEICLATNNLCSLQIINTNQNATNNATKGILRKDLAAFVFRALFGSQTAPTPADNFPVPFADMQTSSSANSLWFKAAKALAYLQFSDDRTPFDRTFINFRPNDSIARIDALKMIMEAWNIRPDASDLTSAATFCDVTSDKINFAYVQKAARLGIVEGNNVDCPCTNTPKCFKPRGYMTRNQAFIIIYRLINKLKADGTANPLLSDKPSNAQLQSLSNYFVPTNYTLANAAQTMGVEQANFNHYTKSSFSIGGRGLPLTFEHSYNSFLTEMPEAFFEGKNTSDADVQTLAPLGIGWTHTYSSYILKVDGYTDYDDNGAPITQNPKYLIAWSNGSFQAYDRATNTYDTEGVYDELETLPSSNDLEYITITTKNQMTYEFISSSAIKFYYLNKITDRNNNGLQMVYDGSFGSQRRLTEVYEIYANNTNNATRRKLVFSYNGTTPYLSSVTDNSINRTINFNVNTIAANLTSFTDAKSYTTTYAYNLNSSAIGEHLLTSIQLPKGNTVTNTYFQRKLQSTATNQNGGRQSKTTVGLTPRYDNANEFTNSSVAVTQGNSTLTTNYKHDDKRRVKSATTPTAAVTVSAYGTGNNMFKPTNVRVNGAGTTNGSSVAMSYDPKGNPLTVTRTYTEGGTSRTLQETFTYNTLNDITSHTDARGNSTTFDYLNGNLSRVVRPLNSITAIGRNTYYQVNSVTNPEGIVTNYTFDDPNGNLSNTTIQGTTISSSATYDNASRVETVTDPEGKRVKVDYDNNDNVTKETDARNAETTYSYDRNDNLLTITDPLQQVTTFAYSEAEDFLKTETFGGHTKTYDYHEDGTLKTFVRGNRSFAYTYDTKGRLETDGQVRLTYDDRNRIATATYQSRVTTYTYDDLDRMTAYEYAANGKTDRVEYTYDENSNVKTIKYPNNKIVTYAYDALNRMETVTDWNNRIVAQYDYKLDGRMNFVSYNNGVKTTYRYDNAGRMNGTTTKKSTNETISDYTFGLDNVGNHTSEQMTEPLLATGLATLGNKNITNPAYSFNRMSQYDDRTFTHDGQGNISTDNTTTNTFDNYDNLTAVTGTNPMTAQYDAGGNRRNLNQNNQNTRYILDILGMSKVLMETDENTGAVQHYYIYGANGLICRLKPDATTTHYYHSDFRGSIVAMTDANQTLTHKYAYDPFGSLISKEEPTGDSNPFRYVGQYGVMQDATNRYFMRARYYDPSVGRFISEDPIAAANLYPYAGNNPINRHDIDGRVDANIEQFYNRDNWDKFFRMSNSFVNSQIGGGFVPIDENWSFSADWKEPIIGTADKVFSEILKTYISNGAEDTYIGIMAAFDAVLIAFDPSEAPMVGEFDIISKISALGHKAEAENITSKSILSTYSILLNTKGISKKKRREIKGKMRNISNQIQAREYKIQQYQILSVRFGG